MTGQGARQAAGFVERTLHHRGRPHRYQVFLPAGHVPDERWPVLLFLHGSGERGDDGVRQTTVGLGPLLRARPEAFPGIVVLPQCPPRAIWAGEVAELALASLAHTLADYGGDRRRIYLGGLSMGGFGTWYLALAEPTMFAALVPICGFISTRLVGAGRPGVDLPDVPLPGIAPMDGGHHARVAARLGDRPVWLFHGAADPVVPVSESRAMATALGAADGAASERVRYTEYPGVGHNAWDAALAEPGLLPWLLAQRR